MKLISKMILLFFIGNSVLLLQNCSSPKKENLLVKNKIPEIIDFNFHVKPILSDRCFKCHGPDEKVREAELRFDTQEGAFAALGELKDHFAIIPFQSDSSTLIQRIFETDPDEMMPPPESNLVLEAWEKEILKKWIAQGANWKKHWSFLPPKVSEIPETQQTSWVKNEIDQFILARLEKEGISPNPSAEKARLLRRASFDLTGLSPNLEEMDAFLSDNSEDAYEKTIDKLLASDAYAERMASIWLDVARYADSHGYQDDYPRSMWPWRDWVIHAFKQNMSYDNFVKWQIAGDLLPEATKEQMLATGFNRNHKITQEGGVIDEEYRVEYVADRTITFGTAFMGLTMECARCHDHKYDPILQKDFYSVFSFFNNLPETGYSSNGVLAPVPNIKFTKEEIDNIFTFINNADTLDAVEVMVMKEKEEARAAFVLNRGNYDQPTDSVQSSAPDFILPYDDRFSKNRKGLVDWLFHKDHPLTARVMVNRLWQQCFGIGIVATPEDFGAQGNLPTHPELLDFLAIKFQKDGWDIKAMLKFILMSATYQQDAICSPELLELDPKNELYARSTRRRLAAEMIRDHALTASNLLNKTVGGPSVRPYQPDGLWAETTSGRGLTKYELDEGDNIYRRSLYTFWKRTVPPPSMMTFDASAREVCTVIRQSTSTPLQALILMNDPQMVEAARVLAYRAVESSESSDERIEYMFRLLTSRKPNPDEVHALNEFFEIERKRFENAPTEAKEVLDIGRYPHQSILEDFEMAAYAMVASAILNLDEAVVI